MHIGKVNSLWAKRYVGKICYEFLTAVCNNSVKVYQIVKLAGVLCSNQNPDNFYKVVSRNFYYMWNQAFMSPDFFMILEISCVVDYVHGEATVNH